MGGLLLLLALCVIMAVGSFLAGVIPLSMTLSQSQLRIISNVGVGILVGTSMIVIIPEGLNALMPHAGAAHSHNRARDASSSMVAARGSIGAGALEGVPAVNPLVRPRGAPSPRMENVYIRDEEGDKTDETEHEHNEEHDHSDGDAVAPGAPEGPAPAHTYELPTFWIGFSMVSGFILMYLIDRLPKHATHGHGHSQPREIRLDSLGISSSSAAEAQAEPESEGFLGGGSPKQSRSLATTTGLVIHAAADGIAMGASSSTSNARLGFIIFFAIMIHKGPAAFGLTSVLLRQGLSKRAARGHLLIFSLAAPAGALATWFLIALLGGSNMDGDDGQWWTGMLLLFSAGTFLYVAVHAMQEDSHSAHESGGMNGFADPSQRRKAGPQVRDTLVTVGGMLLPLLTQIGHHH